METGYVLLLLYGETFALPFLNSLVGHVSFLSNNTRYITYECMYNSNLLKPWITSAVGG